MRHPELPETCDLTELIAPSGSRGFRIAFDNHPCPNAWTEAFATESVRLTKARSHGNVPVTQAAELAADFPRHSPRPRTKVTPLLKRRYEPLVRVRKDAAPLERARQQLAAISARVPQPHRTPAAPAPAPSAPEDRTALARQHLAQLAAASAARVGNQDAEPTVRPGSAADKLRGGGGSTLAQVISRASDNVPGSGGVRWKGGD